MRNNGKQRMRGIGLVVATWLLVSAGTVAAQSSSSSSNTPEFGGDVKLACQATLCLSSGQRPEECDPALQRYFSINGKDAANKRRDFLNQCPTGGQNNSSNSGGNSNGL